MSDEQILTAEEKAAHERRGASGGMRRGPHPIAGMPAEKSRTFLPSARRVLGLLRPERATIGIVLVLAVVSTVLQALGPKILARATDLIFDGAVSTAFPAGITQEQAVAMLRARGNDTIADVVAAMEHFVPGEGIDFGAVGQVLLVVMGLYALGGLLQWILMRQLVGAVNRVIYDLRQAVEVKLGRLPLTFFDAQPRGELLSRVTNDIDNIAQSLQQTLGQLLTSLLSAVAMLVMMFWISPLLTLITVISVPISMVLVAVIGKRSQAHFVAQWASTGQLNGIVEEAYTGHELVKVFGRRRRTQAEFDDRNAALHDASKGAQFVSGIIMPVMQFVGNLGYVAIAVVGGLRVAAGAISVGDVQAVVQYSRQFTMPLAQVAAMANLMQSGVASAERVFEVLDAREQQPDVAAPATITDPRGRVAFEDVSFSYAADRPLITGLSLVVEPGQTVAIVGPTGAGKTTLVNLIMRFYELDGGRITLDGVDISRMTRRDLRSRIGMVLQDTWLFGGTIRDNIAYGRPGASDAEILQAARATYVDRFVHSLPAGYDTLLDAEAGNISAGEKQLLTIARAFLADPALLILDEATSSVDTRTEVLVQHAMAALRADRTSFVIAHRLSTIRDADLILVMEEGRIVEQGSHAELLAAGGAFARLYAAQFAAALLDDELLDPAPMRPGGREPVGPAAAAEPGETAGPADRR